MSDDSLQRLFEEADAVIAKDIYQDAPAAPLTVDELAELFGEDVDDDLVTVMAAAAKLIG